MKGNRLHQTSPSTIVSMVRDIAVMNEVLAVASLSLVDKGRWTSPAREDKTFVIVTGV